MRLTQIAGLLWFREALFVVQLIANHGPLVALQIASITARRIALLRRFPKDYRISSYTGDNRPLKHSPKNYFIRRYSYNRLPDIDTGLTNGLDNTNLFSLYRAAGPHFRRLIRQDIRKHIGPYLTSAQPTVAGDPAVNHTPLVGRRRRRHINSAPSRSYIPRAAASVAHSGSASIGAAHRHLFGARQGLSGCARAHQG